MISIRVSFSIPNLRVQTYTWEHWLGCGPAMTPTFVSMNHESYAWCCLTLLTVIPYNAVGVPNATHTTSDM